MIVQIREWQVAGIRNAVASLDRGEGIAHESVEAWVKSWDSKRERSTPRHLAKRSATGRASK